MFRPFIILFAILLQIFAVSAHKTLPPQVQTCKLSSECAHLGHDQVDCINGKCVVFQHPHKKRAGK